jgi:hypothetical protein
MHQHECNSHIEPIYLIQKNQTKAFSYTIFPVKKINVEKNFKIMRKLLFNYSIYSHPEVGKYSGCDKHYELRSSPFYLWSLAFKKKMTT